MKVTTASTIEELRLVEAPLKELARNLLSENIFYESFLLLPAFEFLRTDPVIVVLVWSENARNLIGVFPLEIKSRYHHFPIHYFSLWRHIHCFLSTPLIRVGYEQACLQAFYSWLLTQENGRLLFQFEQVSEDDAFFPHLEQFIKDNKLKSDFIDRHDRPLLRSDVDGNKYVETAISSKHLKDLKKKAAKLSSFGAVDYVLFSEKENLFAWIEDFLQLEKSGWKGRNDTAMACHENEAFFFHAATANAFLEKRLLLFKMTLNGKPIAMRCGFQGIHGAFSFKIAFDESYEKFSPGVLLEIEHIHHIQNAPDHTWVDSCSMPGSVLLERLWRERRTISSLVVSTNSFRGRSLVASFSELKRLKSLSQRSPPITTDAGHSRAP